MTNPVLFLSRRLLRNTIPALTLCAGLSLASAEDWPQWMGPQRDGVWRETGIRESIPSDGVPIKWRVPVKAGYVGPAVADGRVYLIDREAGKMPERKRGEKPTLAVIPGNERVLCLDAATGATVWERTQDVAYRISYPAGPRATPLVKDGRVYTLGAMGDFQCFTAAEGKTVWSRNLLRDFQLTDPPIWGWAAHPLLDGERLITLVGGTNSAVVAFHKDTGAEVWRALTAEEVGYAPPLIYEIAGRRTLVIWHPEALSGLDPVTGQVWWTHRYPVTGKPKRPEVTIAAPRWDGRRLFLTSFYHGSQMFEPGVDSVRLVWDRHSSKESEMDDGLHTIMCTPVWKEGFLYGVCGFGELRCLDAATGERRWQTYATTGGEQGFFANAFLVTQGERTWIWNDHGELILGQLTPEGFKDLGRVKLLEPWENTRGRDVLWCHPAFANRHAYLHNGREFLCVDLSAPGKPG